MAQIIWTEPALADLNDIAEYIALDKLGAAKYLVKKVFSSVERLEDFPESGRVPLELMKSRYREVIVGPCRIFYRYTQDKVYILYVMRSERKLRKYLLADRTYNINARSSDL
nr:type II toxin-antitoxin system RelE/ParE family toxin [Desulfobulbaceae bacterium]